MLMMQLSCYGVTECWSTGVWGVSPTLVHLSLDPSVSDSRGFFFTFLSWLVQTFLSLCVFSSSAHREVKAQVRVSGLSDQHQQQFQRFLAAAVSLEVYLSVTAADCLSVFCGHTSLFKSRMGDAVVSLFLFLFFSGYVVKAEPLQHQNSTQQQLQSKRCFSSCECDVDYVETGLWPR